jgi:hypothetical protein
MPTSRILAPFLQSWEFAGYVDGRDGRHRIPKRGGKFDCPPGASPRSLVRHNPEVIFVWRRAGLLIAKESHRVNSDCRR